MNSAGCPSGPHRNVPAPGRSQKAARFRAESAGFVEEGVLRSNAWVDGAFEDEVVLGMIAADWFAARAVGQPW